MSSDNCIVLSALWKKYSKRAIFHKSIREDMLTFFGTGGGNGLRDDEFWALQDISLRIRQGESVGFYGPNGSGKSTILKLIANVTYPTKGSISVSGRVAPLIELGAGFHPDLTGRENIFMNGTILGMSIASIKKNIGFIIDFSGLSEFIDVPVKKYSSGMCLRLAFSIAIQSPADIFLFDEILIVGDEEFQNKCLLKIDDLRKSGKTIIIVSHDICQLKSVADRVVYIKQGCLTGAEAIR